jgi:dihydrofolate reductase
MRRIRYQVASSLDGYIAGPDGEFDWIVPDPDIDFEALFAEFDALLMGRRTFEGVGSSFPDKDVYVFSRTLRPEDHPGVTIVSDRIGETLDRLREAPGRDIWLFGGGQLFRSLLELGYVDTVELAMIPILLGEGRPFLPPPAATTGLAYRGHRVYKKSGIVLLEYDVVPPSAEGGG